MAVYLIHGGIAEDVGADRFWVQSGIVQELESAGFDVAAPDHDTSPRSWVVAADRLASTLRGPTTVVTASSAVSIGVRLALDYPEVVDRLVLLWPATQGVGQVDSLIHPSAAHLLPGGVIRGVLDEELCQLDLPVAVMAAEPENLAHQHETVASLVELIDGAVRIEPGSIESVHPAFAE